jgi:uncharacterized protein (DUF2062 family)
MTEADAPFVPPSQPPPPPRGPWNRFKAHILHPELSPEQLAWSFCLGFSIAWNPLLGLHTGMALLFCVIFRKLHRPLLIMAMLINNPWTMVPIATASAWLGSLLRGHLGTGHLAQVQWHQIGWRSFLTWDGFEAMTTMLRPVLKSYLLGGTICTLLALPIGYFFMLWLTHRLRRIHWPHFHGHAHSPNDTQPGG